LQLLLFRNGHHSILWDNLRVLLGRIFVSSVPHRLLQKPKYTYLKKLKNLKTLNTFKLFLNLGFYQLWLKHTVSKQACTSKRKSVLNRI